MLLEQELHTSASSSEKNENYVIIYSPSPVWKEERYFEKCVSVVVCSFYTMKVSGAQNNIGLH